MGTLSRERLPSLQSRAPVSIGRAAGTMSAPAGAHVEALIVRMLAPSGGGGSDVASAEAALRAFLPHASAPGALCWVLERSPHEAARQMAGLLLRRSVVALWGRSDTIARAALQALLLSVLAGEPSRGVRKAVIACVASLARMPLPGSCRIAHTPCSRHATWSAIHVRASAL